MNTLKKLNPLTLSPNKEMLILSIIRKSVLQNFHGIPVSGKSQFLPHPLKKKQLTQNRKIRLFFSQAEVDRKRKYYIYYPLMTEKIKPISNLVKSRIA